MRNFLSVFLLSLLVFGCDLREQKVYTEKPISEQPKWAQDAYKQQVASGKTPVAPGNENEPGQLLKAISFQVATDDKKTFEDGYIPWLEISQTKNEIKKLKDAGEVVINDPSIQVVIDYPLTNKYTFELKSPKGFTRAQLALAVEEHYNKLYAEEERTATVKTEPMEKRTIMNRNKTNGKYGIWGHDITDLALSEINVYKSADGKIWLLLDIQS